MALHEHIIKVYCYATIEKLTEYRVHYVLELLGYIEQPKWHDSPFVRFVSTSKYIFILVIRLHRQLIITTL